MFTFHDLWNSGCRLKPGSNVEIYMCRTYLLGTTLAPVRTELTESNDVTNVTSIHVVDLRLKLEQLKTVF